MIPLSDRINIALVIITVLSLGGALYSWYWSKFRYAEVLTWSLDSIRALQRLYLLSEHDLQLGNSSSHPDLMSDKLRSSFDEISLLVEVGRVFFQNTPGRFELEGWGAEKPQAYRGLRPIILDYLVCGLEVADEWPRASPERKVDLRDIILEAERQFVSVVQSEAGRPRTISPHSGAQGKSRPIHWVLHELRAREEEFRKRMHR